MYIFATSLLFLSIIDRKMKTTQKKLNKWWLQVIKVIVILATTLASSQVATTSPIIDSAVKVAIQTTANIFLDALSSNSKDTAIIITAKPYPDPEGQQLIK